MHKPTPYDHLRFCLPDSDEQLSFLPVFRDDDGEFSHFNVMRGDRIVGWDWDLVGAIETADEIASGELQFNFELNPQPWTPEEEPSKCAVANG